MSAAETDISPVVRALHGVLDPTHVLTDAHSRTLFAQDVYTRSLPALAVVQPSSTEELSNVVACVASHRHAIVPRGGGMSYTSGYVPKEAGSVVVDLSRLNQVLEVNTEDMYVTVQCGCTWNDLHQALEGTGLRTAFWGTLSGIRATVGGGLSQNSIFWGSGRYGTAADSVIGLEVVLADGTVVHTGSGAQRNAGPFFRHFGPDLTGLFTSDAGALGFKATATLRLIPERQERRGASFDFDDSTALIEAMNEIGRQELADECFAFDPYLQSVRMQRESIMSDVKKLAGVAKAGKGVLGALKDSAKVALAGRGYMKNVKYSLHVMLEHRTAAAADEDLAAVRALCSRHGGAEIENSIPKILRANPFTPLNNVVGPRGEHWLPVHVLVPHSKARSTFAQVEQVMSNHAEAIERLGIGVGYLLVTVSTNGFVIEPVFFTPDRLTEIHEHVVEPAIFNKLPRFEPNEDARALTATLRSELLALFEQIGGIHMQIGKAYRYRQGLRDDTWSVVESIKRALDPAGRVNPGALGLDIGAQSDS